MISEKKKPPVRFILLMLLQVMLPLTGLLVIVLIVSLFRTGRAAEFLRLFALYVFLGGFAFAVLRTLWVFLVAAVRHKLRDRNDKDERQTMGDLSTTKNKVTGTASGAPLQYVIRPPISAYITYIFLAVGVPILALYIYFYGAKPYDMGFLALMLVSIAGFAAIGGVARFRIIIRDDTISYRSMFTRDRSLKLREIASAKVGRRNRGSFSISLVLTPYPEAMKKRMIIIMYFFSKKDVQILFGFFGEKLVH